MEFVKLEKLCSIITDGTHQTPTYSNEGYIFLSSKNVTSKKIDWDNVKYIPEELHKELCKRLKPQKNDILLAKNGTTGVAALVDRDEVFDIYVSLALLRPNEAIYPSYLLHAINSPMTKRQFNKSLKGIGVPNLHLKEIKNVYIPVPDIYIQNKIVEVLDKAQELIDKRKAQIEALDELVKSRFIEMFGEPANNPNNYDVVPFDKIIDYIGDIGSNGANATISANLKMTDTEDYALMVRTLNFTSNDFKNNIKYVSKEVYDFFKKSQIFGGELIFNKIGSAGINFIMPYLNRPVSLGLNQVMVRTNEKVNMIYLHTLLNTDYGKHQINRRIQGAVTKSITKGAIKEIPILLSPIELQNQFAVFAKQVDKLKFEMEKSLKELEDNFNSLMQKAFNGELFD